MNGKPVLPPTEEIMTMRPGEPFRDRSTPRSGAKAWVTINCPTRLTSI